MTGFYMCFTLAVLFWVLALVFAVFGEKATNLLSGFNFLSKEEKEKYDRRRMAADYRNVFFLWGLVMLLGALGAYWISGYAAPAACAACAVWLVLFFKDMHLDMDKAYGKYKKADED